MERSEEVKKVLKEMAAELNDHKGVMEAIQERDKVFTIGVNYSRVHIKEGLKGSGLEGLTRLYRGKSPFPTQYEIAVDGVVFFELSDEPFEPEPFDV